MRACAALLLLLQARLWQNQSQTYGTLIPNDTMALLLGLVGGFWGVCVGGGGGGSWGGWGLP